MNGHFFDLNSLITMNSKVWIVNTRTPNKPLIRISKSEFNLLRKGVYKKDNINFNIDGQTYWLSEELFNKIKAFQTISKPNSLISSPTVLEITPCSKSIFMNKFRLFFF